MATIYICKCGRQVRKNTSADNTGNRDTAGCRGCPYLLPWGPTEWTGKGFEQNVQGHECRMSPEISYATDYSGSANDKCTLKIHSLDLDFLEDIQAWIDEYADGQLSGRFSRDTIRGTDYCNKGRYSWSISCAQNKKGMAAKAALIERFFGPDKHRLDKTPEEEKAIVLAAIEVGKAKANRKEDIMQAYINRFETVFAVRNHKGAPALMCRAKDSAQWVMSGTLAAVKGDAETIGELQEVLNKAAQEYGWKPVEGDAQLENPTSSAAATAAAEETVAAPEPSDSASMMAAPVAKASEPAGVASENVLAGADGLTAFDYSGLDDQTVADLHLAEREYSSGKKMAEMGLRRMADAVAIAHDVLVANCEGHNQHSEDTFSAWCQSIGLKKDSAYRMLQVSKLMDDSSPREQKVLEELSPSLLYAAAKPSAPAELVQAVKDGDITTHKQYQEALAEIKARDAKIQELLEMSENSDRRADQAEAKAKKAEQERDAARDAQANLSAMANKFSKQRDAAEQRVEDAEQRAEEAECRAQAAEAEVKSWEADGQKMQEIVDDQQAVIEEQKARIGELESGITVEAAAVDQAEIERRANELSEPLVKIIDQQNEQIERMASGNTVSAQASVLEQYLRTMQTSLLSNAQRAELAFYDIGALDSLARALREFADSIDGIFEDRSEDND